MAIGRTGSCGQLRSSVPNISLVSIAVPVMLHTPACFPTISNLHDAQLDLLVSQDEPHASSVSVQPENVISSSFFAV